jgi:uncharacterized protein
MDQLHPGAKWLFRFGAYSPLIFIGIFVTIWSFQFLKFLAGNSIALSFILAVIFYLIFVLIVAEIYARMSYNRWFYELNNENIKIEHGIIWKKYTSIPYERVQNIDIRRGIIARMAGFSSLEIETAGQSGFSGGYGIRFGGKNRKYHSEGYLPAISMPGAEKIREFVMKKIKQTHLSKQGL